MCGVPWLRSWKDCSVAGKTSALTGDHGLQTASAPRVTLGKSPPLSGPQSDSKMGADSCLQCPLLPGTAVTCLSHPCPATRLPPPASPPSVLTPPPLGLSPTPPPEPAWDSLAFFSPSLPPSPSPQLSPPGITLSSPPPQPWISSPSVLPPSYFLAITSQRHPDVSPQITSRDLGFRSEILYFCTTGWAPGPRRKTCPPPCPCCLHLLG